jgi:hypothetical protein
MPVAVAESLTLPWLGFETNCAQPTSSWPVGCSGNVVPGAPASASAGPAPRASAPATTAVPTPRRILSLMTFPFLFDDLSIVVLLASQCAELQARRPWARGVFFLLQEASVTLPSGNLRPVRFSG